MNVLYILDEPSIGLHQRDNEKLLGALRGLQSLGNTLIVGVLFSDSAVGSSGVTQKVTMAVLHPQGMVIMMSSHVTVPGSVSGRRVA